ncbi:hypothetical protein PAXRUDRAFT_550252 [Paxillus rubicundulus Ve08.2h10]|uniref:Uncharacterized protein n=1 Tax=Paxillus rubicundulus Ve08.2h10 TaxID=930991 RepID=A0A0D0E5R8_9AGAM|nr:hypothetical protein PAXRUDRAFT_550252 [Paxillus rubicundulus Ve08.2h10]
MLAYNSPAPAYPSLHNYQFPSDKIHFSDDDGAPVYDVRGRQKTFTESLAQRRERIEFLKRREWARRVTEWVRETNSQEVATTFGRSRPFPPSLAQEPYTRAHVKSTPQASVIPFPQAEEEEPYIIYSSSPTSSFSSLSEDITPVLPLNNATTSSLNTAGGVSHLAQRSSSGHHRRRSSASLRGHTSTPSLSSISEVPEED